MGESGWVGCIRMFLRVADPRSGWQAGRRHHPAVAGQGNQGSYGWVSGDIEDEDEDEDEDEED